MFHVINNSLATSDGFTYYSISFGIKHAYKSQQGGEYSVPNIEACESDAADEERGTHRCR